LKTDATRQRDLGKMMSNKNTGRLLRVNVVAERLGIPVRTVYRLIESGALPACKLSPRGLRVSAAELERYRKSNELGRF